ncbi:response regulator [Hydrocarboniphaga effusa]|jgi:signal transduction histidine kinase/CheY-like chemotaxis protein|uniref:response regulator n=1 Tax=Hydrocarboniphaga effusa TaxID=243629 RepID=UPI00313814C7
MDAAFPVWPRVNSQTAALVRAFDWSRTSLGPIASWPQSLRTTVEIVLGSPVAMVLMCGRDHVMIYNDAYSLIAGKRHPQALGGTVPSIWPEIWESWNRRIIEAGFRGETLTYTDQQLLLMRNGAPEEVWFDLYYAPTRDEAGEVSAILCTVVETTAKVLALQRQQQNEQQLKRLNEELRAQREAIEAANRKLEAETDFLRDMFQHSPSFIAVLRGPDHVFELLNEPYQRLIGDREVLGKPIREVMPEVAEQGFVDLLDRVYRTGEPFVGTHVSVLLRRRDDEELREHILDFVYQPIRAKDGAVIAIFVEGTDATDRASAEERLRIAQKAGGIGAFEWFPETGEVVISDEFRRIWNLPADSEVSADTLVSLVLPDDRKRTGPALLENTPNPLDYTEYRIRDPQTGDIRWLARRGEVIQGNDRLPQRYVGVCFDITARKSIEEELRVLNDTLEHRVATEVAERSAAEEALRQAQKMEAVGQLTGGIAHDFNNLLQGIVGSLDLVQTYITRGRLVEADRFVGSAMTSANRAAALTHRLLAFARRQPLDPKPVHANQLIASMEDLLRRSLGVSIDIELVLAGGLWMTRCDTNQLENAILNLAINARDAMPQGGKLTIETCNAHLDNAYAARQREVTPGQYVCICVTDTGDGMTPEVITRAFDPFFTTKPVGQGTGLGLSMIYGFARQSEGYAKIYSEVGKGTTVKLYLPRFHGNDEDHSIGLEAEHSPVHNAGETILLVEDERVVRALVAEVLQELGYSVLEAADGPTAVKLLDSERRIDLLVTDIGLPGLNGRQVADTARKLRPELKVLFMTGYAENAAVSSGFLEPGMQMITKPFPMKTLSSRVGDLIGKPRGGPAKPTR